MTFKRTSQLGLVALALSLAACGEKGGDSSDSTSPTTETGTSSTEATASDGESTSASDSESSSSTDTTSESGDSADDGSFVNVDQAVESMCDIWNPNDCPEGEKCMPYASGGSSWDALKCIPIAENPKVLGDECNAPLGGAGGEDDCDGGLFCYYVDSETQVGTCISFCTGSAEMPVCEADTLCSIVNDGVLVLCRPTCDPIVQDCEPAGSACLQATGSEGFVCIIDASGADAGAYGDNCEFLNSCDPGLACADAAGVPGCTGSGCCSPFCDTSAMNECPDAAMGQICEPWFETPVPGYETVGLCVLPTPDIVEPPSAFSARLQPRPEVMPEKLVSPL
jgi:hypothetical protein